MVFVEPCIVESFRFKDSFSYVFYSMGEKEKNNIGGYEFVQEPECGYPVVVDTANLTTPYVIHNAETRDFSVP